MNNSQKKRHTKADMFQLIEKWKAGTLTIKSFCHQQGIASSVFHYWNRKHKQSKQKSKGGFIPIEVQSAVEPLPSPVIEITYPNGLVLKLPAVMPVSIVKQYLRK
jgi:transposase-like protein